MKVVQRGDDDRSGNRRLNEPGRQRDEPQHRQAQGDGVGYCERRNNSENPKKSLAEARYGQPSSVTVLEHRREQQGAEKQDVIEAGPNMPNPGSKIFEKLAPERNRVTFELPGIVIRAEHRRMGSALLLQAKQTTVLRIQAKEKPVLNLSLIHI